MPKIPQHPDKPKEAPIEQEAQAEENRKKIETVLTEDQKGAILGIARLASLYKVPNGEMVMRHLDKLPQELDLSSHEEYAEAIKKIFAWFISSAERSRYKDRLEYAKKIYKETRGVDFSETVKTLFFEVRELRKGVIHNLFMGDNFTFTLADTEKYRGEIEKGFLESLKNGKIPLTLTYRDKLGKGIDFTQLEGYRDAAEKGYFICLAHWDVDNASLAQKEFGQGVDYTKLKDYEKKIKRSFFFLASNIAKPKEALELQKKLGQGIDFTPEVREAFLANITQGLIPEAIEIKEVLGRDLDLDEEIQVGFWKCMDNGMIESAIDLLQALGRNIEFEDFEEGMKSNFLAHRLNNDVETLLKALHVLRKPFPNHLKDKKYQELLAFIASECYPHFDTYLSDEIMDDELETGELRNEFFTKQDSNITPALLIKFESLIHRAQAFIRQSLKEKIKEWGIDPDDPNYKTELTDDQKLELRRLMEEKQEAVQLKIQAIASPQLIEAYRCQSEEDETGLYILNL